MRTVKDSPKRVWHSNKRCRRKAGNGEGSSARVAMLSGAFKRSVGYLGILAGIVALVASVPGIYVSLVFMNLLENVLYALWLFVLSGTLLRMSK